MIMSPGLTTYDFVQQVYYAQEKVILDFWPDDDKFKEVLMEANLILQELQNVEDWTWLREHVVLGPLGCRHGEIPEFTMPDWVYKPSTLNHDSLKLYEPPFHDYHPWHPLHMAQRYIEVPFASTGDNTYRKEHGITLDGVIHAPDIHLRAIRVGNVITFSRKPFPHEYHLLAVMDVQKRIEQFHICNSTCTYEEIGDHRVCTKELDHEGNEIRHLSEIPDPNYLIMATAARHAEGSPPALARVAGLQDAAQKIMSAMRQNDAAATDSDWQDWETPGYVEVI